MVDLLRAAAGQEPDDTLLRADAQLASQRRLVHLGREIVEQWMAHVRGVDSRVPKQPLLERKHHAQAVDPGDHFGGALGMPRPHLGRDVVEDARPAAFERWPDAEVEARRVHEDRGVRLELVVDAQQAPVRAPQPRQARQHGRESDHRELVHGHFAFRPGVLERRPGDAADAAWAQLPQSRD